MLAQEKYPMTRSRWSERDRTETQVRGPFAQINRALSENVPATLSSKEVKTITGFSGNVLKKEMEAGRFPKPMNPDNGCWFKWASVDIRDWLIENGLPTVFGKEAADA